MTDAFIRGVDIKQEAEALEPTNGHKADASADVIQ
jgi:hypothetical protein